MWLATISTVRISDPAVRAKLERNQREAADVLRRHFLHRGESPSMNLLAEVGGQRKGVHNARGCRRSRGCSMRARARAALAT